MIPICTQTNFFKLFNLPQRFNIDLEELDRRYYALSKEMHPDRLQLTQTASRADACEKMSVINEGHRTLKDKQCRRLHLLQIMGVKADNRSHAALLPDLANHWFELEDSLEHSSKAKAIESLKAFENKLKTTEDAQDKRLNTLEQEFDVHYTLNRIDHITGILHEIMTIEQRRKTLQSLKRHTLEASARLGSK